MPFTDLPLDSLNSMSSKFSPSFWWSVSSSLSQAFLEIKFFLRLCVSGDICILVSYLIDNKNIWKYKHFPEIFVLFFFAYDVVIKSRHILFISIYLFILSFLWPHPKHIEFPMLGV